MKPKLFSKLLFFVFSLTTIVNFYGQTTYYVSASGNDSNNGTSTATPWLSLNKVSNAAIQPGDKVLFKRGDTFIGELKPTYSGASGAPITFSAYGTGDRPIITGSGGPGGDYLAAIYINNQDHFELSELEIQNERLVSREGVNDTEAFGLYVHNTSTDIMRHFNMFNLTVQNVYGITKAGVPFNDMKVAGIYCRSERNEVVGQEKNIQDVTLDGSFFTRTGKFGFWSQHKGAETGVGNDSINRNMNFKFTNNHFYKTGGSGITPGRTYNCLVENNIFENTGSNIDSRMAKRGSGAWFFNCQNVVAQYNKSYSARGGGDSYGLHIDSRNKHVIFQYNYSEDNQGFVEVLGNNEEVCYRFNVSVNDGRRAKKGNTFWFSRYDSSPGKSNNVYVYNNSIYVSNLMQGSNTNVLKPGLQLRAKTSYIVNNAIYVKTGGHIGYKQFTKDAAVNVDNNVYYGDVRETDFVEQDAHAIKANPLYVNPGAIDSPDAYKLEASSPAIGAGAAIPREPLFPQAGKGIFSHITANAIEDYWGNPVDLSVSGTNIGAYNGSGEASLGNNERPTGPIFEAENATFSGGLELIKCSGLSGAYGARKLSDDQAVSFNDINVLSAGVYNITVTYQSKTDENLTYAVNGGAPETVSVLATSSSFCFEGGQTGSHTLQLPLNAGYNSLVFTEAPILDTIEVGVSVSQILEAEDAVLTGTAEIVSCDKASGGEMVKNIKGGVNNAVEYQNIQVANSGDYNMTVSYYAKNSRNLSYSINNGAVQTVAILASGNWCYAGGTPAEHTIQIPLNSGSNSILFYNAPVIDKIELSPNTNVAAKSATKLKTLSLNDTNDNGDAMAVAIFPNSVVKGEPVSVHLSAKLPSNSKVLVSVYDRLGRTLIEEKKYVEKTTNAFTVSTHSLTGSSIYFMKITVAQKSVVKRLVIK